MKRKLALIIAAAAMLLTACAPAEEAGNLPEAEHTESAARTEITAEADVEVTAEQTKATEITEVTEATTVQTESNTEITTAEPNENPPAKLTADEEMLLDIARNGFDAIVSKNAKGIVKYTTYDAYYYLSYGELTDEETLTKLIGKSFEEAGVNYSAVLAEGFSALKNMEFVGVSPLPQSELDGLNEFIRLLAEKSDTELKTDYEFSEAYKLKVHYDGIEEEIKNSGSEPYMIIAKVNGEWKLDVSISITKEVFDSLQNMKN